MSDRLSAREVVEQAVELLSRDERKAAAALLDGSPLEAEELILWAAGELFASYVECRDWRRADILASLAFAAAEDRETA